MPYKDPEQARIAANERKRRYRHRQKVEKYGPDSAHVDMRGKHGNHARGARNGRWNEQRIMSEHGYVKVRVGREHPLADPNGYAYEHQVVWCAAGRSLPKQDELIHHRNGDKSDNRLANLERMKRSQHATHHNAERPRDAAGRFVGKKAAGRELDGREWNEMPEIVGVQA